MPSTSLAHPNLFASRKPLLTRQDIASLLGVNKTAVMKWEKTGKLVQVARDPRGRSVFSFDELAVTLREAVSLGLVPVFSKRKKRCRQHA